MEMKLKTWDEIETFDDIFLPREKRLISELERELKKRCPCLQKEGSFFFYCGKDMPELEDRKPGPFNPIYTRHSNAIELQLYCMGDFEKCCFYNGRLRR